MGGIKEGYSGTEWVIALVIGAVFFWGLKSCSIFDDKPSKPEAPRELVENSDWDASVRQVKQYLKEHAKDASSIEYLEWSRVKKQPDGTFLVRVKYRAKNSFGAYVVENNVFSLSSRGQVTGMASAEVVTPSQQAN